MTKNSSMKVSSKDSYNKDSKDKKIVPKLSLDSSHASTQKKESLKHDFSNSQESKLKSEVSLKEDLLKQEYKKDVQPSNVMSNQSLTSKQSVQDRKDSIKQEVLPKESKRSLTSEQHQQSHHEQEQPQDRPKDNLNESKLKERSD